MCAKYYLPEQGETEKDIREAAGIYGASHNSTTAEAVAEAAYASGEISGDEESIVLVLVLEDGSESRWRCYAHPTVTYAAERAIEDIETRVGMLDDHTNRVED